MTGLSAEHLRPHLLRDSETPGTTIVGLLGSTLDFGIAIEHIVTTMRSIPDFESVYFVPSYNEMRSGLQVIGIWRGQVDLLHDAPSLRTFSTTVGESLQPFEAQVRSDSQIFDSRRPFNQGDIRGQFVHVVLSQETPEQR